MALAPNLIQKQNLSVKWRAGKNTNWKIRNQNSTSFSYCTDTEKVEEKQKFVAAQFYWMKNLNSISAYSGFPHIFKNNFSTFPTAFQ